MKVAENTCWVLANREQIFGLKNTVEDKAVK
jgi:hypothetical protein